MEFIVKREKSDNYNIVDTATSLSYYSWSFFSEPSSEQLNQESDHAIAQSRALFFFVMFYLCKDNQSIVDLYHFVPNDPDEFDEAVKQLDLGEYQDSLREVIFSAYDIYCKIKTGIKIKYEDLPYFYKYSDYKLLTKSKTFIENVLPDIMKVLKRLPDKIGMEAHKAKKEEYAGIEIFYKLDDITYPELNEPKRRSADEIYAMYPEIDPKKLYVRVRDGFLKILKEHSPSGSRYLLFRIDKSYWELIKEDTGYHGCIPEDWEVAMEDECLTLVENLCELEKHILWVYLCDDGDNVYEDTEFAYDIFNFIVYGDLYKLAQGEENS